MPRFIVVSLLTFCAVCASAQSLPSSDPYAISLAQQSVAALTGGAPINDATLSGSATWIAGSDKETGTVTLSTKGTTESRMDLNLSASTRTEIRNDTVGYPQGASILNGGNQRPWALHNCWINASWFFAALSALVQSADPDQIFLYVGLEKRNGLSVRHLKTYHYTPAKRPEITALNQMLSTMDIYLDSTSLLPLAFTFNTHADDDSATNIAMEVDFSNYQPVEGILVPFRVQKLIWNGLALDITLTSANFNAGVPDTGRNTGRLTGGQAHLLLNSW